MLIWFIVIFRVFLSSNDIKLVEMLKIKLILLVILLKRVDLTSCGNFC